MKCLIIAAGKGTRLKRRGDSKPLVPILGLPLIERVIRSAIKAGIDDFCVVTGYNGDAVRPFLDRLAGRCHVSLSHVINDEWENGNGLSVLKAKGCLDEKFILLMADHLFDSALVSRLKEQPLGEGEVTLAIDYDLNNPLVDLADVTKVMENNGKISDIGKHLERFNGFDTGIFLCTTAIFQEIARSISEDGDCSLSGGVRRLAGKGKVNAFDIQGKFWIDVDDPASLKKAQQGLLDQLRSKPNDGPISRYLNRPVSVRISKHLAKISVTPNQISLTSFLFSLLATGLFLAGGYIALAIGGLLAQFASVIDGCDGEIARLKFLESDFGGWFDAVLDRYADAFLLFGLTWYAHVVSGRGLDIFVGFMAIIGSFMLSYTADKYDALMRRRLKSGQSLRLGRDVRVFLICLGALLNQPFAVLLIIAGLMNAETVHRVVLCRGNG